ncbi:unnamed protein product [Brachionus calyciflorus]|uniref:Uncharacterized protein n=1 Tax=Brachionus calyciflorus TaxID=104777 RepID=A0A813TW74_9BILA|nr:unnamed protein product [Brachionus calyciflorus]
MNAIVDQLFGIYFDHSSIQKEINAFVKFHEESPASFDMEPSLTHIENSLKELNQTRLPNLIANLEGDKILLKVQSLNSNFSNIVDTILKDFEEKEKENEQKKKERQIKFEKQNF